MNWKSNMLHIYCYIRIQTTTAKPLNRVAIGPTLNDQFSEVLGFKKLEQRYNGFIWAIIWGSNKAIDIGE